MGVDTIWWVLSLISLGIWLILLSFWGQFWRANQRLAKPRGQEIDRWPSVCAIVPARNEAEVLPTTLRSLLTQSYPGSLRVVLVDDQSIDGTAAVARSVAQTVRASHHLSTEFSIITTDALPYGWSGKMWAVHQGVDSVLAMNPADWPDYLLLTDADILHDPNNLKSLITKAELEQLDLVSLMVLLRCQSLWERFLIPAFVFFFQKLYPFPWVNSPERSTAAAAGGCILLRREALVEAGGMATIKDALIDDCALAAVIKSRSQYHADKGRIWLGLDTKTRSLRPYDSLATIWNMVARTAFTQLNYSTSLLVIALMAMIVIYLIPPISVGVGLWNQNWLLMLEGMATWLLMAWAYWPTVRLYRLSFGWALTMPAIAVLYTLMTLDGALRHWQGRGGAWKGRVYPARSAQL